MRTIHTLSLFGAMMSSLHAQPVLTMSGNTPTPGVSYSLNYGAYIAPGADGAGQTWDLTALSIDSTAMIQWVAPSATPDASAFPGATVAETGTAATVYFQGTADGVDQLGYSADGSIVPYADPGRFLPFPCAYGSSWTDTFEGQYDLDGTTIDRSGTIAGAADGYGTLLLPTGSVSNVLRVHWQQTTDDVTPMFSFQTIHDSYLYYTPGTAYPLAQLVTITSIFMGNIDVVSFAQWVGSVPTATAGPALHPGAECHPVPATGIVRVRLPFPVDTSTSFTITDASGRRISIVPVIGRTSSDMVLDILQLPAGVYSFTAVHPSGDRASCRFIKE